MKKIRQGNHRIVVHPYFRDTILLGPDLVAGARDDICRELASRILSLSEVKSVGYESDPVPVCSHCGAEWTEEGDTYNGGCCAEDAQHAPAEEVES